MLSKTYITQASASEERLFLYSAYRVITNPDANYGNTESLHYLKLTKIQWLTRSPLNIDQFRAWATCAVTWYFLAI